VQQLPDYKASFPQWSRQSIMATVPGLDLDGLELLEEMLIYDTAKRISGELRPFIKQTRY
jgi:cyclin-dependent kinase